MEKLFFLDAASSSSSPEGTIVGKVDRVHVTVVGMVVSLLVMIIAMGGAILVLFILNRAKLKGKNRYRNCINILTTVNSHKMFY